MRVPSLALASAWMSFGAFAVGILAYVFQVLMGRLLSTSDYGVFSAMMALFSVLAAPLGTLQMVVSRKVSEYRAAEGTAAIAHFYRAINLRAGTAGAILLVVYALFAPSLQHYLKAPSIVPVYLVGGLLFLSFLPMLNNAFLQGMQQFGWLSGTGAIAAIVKIGLSGLLVALGFGLSGAIAGVMLTACATWVMSYAPLHRVVAGARPFKNPPSHLSWKSAVPVFFANGAFAAMTQIDMVLVNYFFAPREASLYAAASVLGKAVLYLPGGIANALFPMVAENKARNAGTVHLLMQALKMTAAVCVLGSLLFLAFGDVIIVLLYGESYRGAGPVLRYFGFAILPMAFVMVAEFFLIAQGRVLFAYLFAAIAPLQLLAVYLWHDSLLTVVGVVAASGVMLALTGYALLWRSLRESPA
jgi:O-antigen/teichoic acid export membrane protein